MTDKLEEIRKRLIYDEDAPDDDQVIEDAKWLISEVERLRDMARDIASSAAVEAVLTLLERDVPNGSVTVEVNKPNITPEELRQELAKSTDASKTDLESDHSPPDTPKVKDG